jgi:hypothetical protein
MKSSDLVRSQLGGTLHGLGKTQVTSGLGMRTQNSTRRASTCQRTLWTLGTPTGYRASCECEKCMHSRAMDLGNKIPNFDTSNSSPRAPDGCKR